MPALTRGIANSATPAFGRSWEQQLIRFVGKDNTAQQ